MEKSRIQARAKILALAAGLVVGVAACDQADEVPPPNPTDTPNVPEPVNPATVPSPTPTPTPPPDGTAGTAPAPGEATAGPIAGVDRSFISEAMSRGLAEVEASRLATTKAADPKVKSFAEKLQKDHTEANAKLQSLATSKGMTVSTTIDPAVQGKLDELEKLSGAEFDRAYLENFGASAHQETITLFERQARDGQDPDLKAFAEETLGVLRSHLELAQQLQPAGAAAQ
ncbi:DUF4142 domain-containing protein [Aromatoleum aromaticum]|uniref:DUF4142 domain-containing protein n=1 Tax=Aromatoleum aromaticum (strain DSM 19018 / LMG 30748 / EbN1) TaxID=76114 RepID=Q5NXZ0_AROAE|nr:DUF4142 domain-containing protein [Aromatoleum aromaticum]NMG56455.1 DUF4142 domain-containing protein [Aromatoleum aromaticum]CAI10074.1 hypothetical protein ebA6930 [Aromatoleum aromaticum EbN1]